MLLALIALALSLIFGGTTPTVPVAPPSSQLPATQPGLSRDEGVFLFTIADDGSRAIYFIAANSRHSILDSDAQQELQLNPLWPLRQASQDEVLAFPEGAPIGNARTGLLTAPTVPADDAAAADDSAATDAGAAVDPGAAVDAGVADQAQADQGQPAQYVLRPGDNLTRIAAAYGSTVPAILAANGLTNPNRILAGQTLTIPTGADTVQSPADTAPVAESSPVADTAPVADASPVADAASVADDVAAADPTADVTYTVKPGDSAIGIARKFGVDEGALLDANAITNPNRVYVGQVLTIPG